MKQQHGNHVGQPTLLALFVDPSRRIECDLDRTQYRRQERALAIEDARHIRAEHRRDRDNNRAIDQNLDPANRSHDTPLRIFRAAAERR